MLSFVEQPHLTRQNCIYSELICYPLEKMPTIKEKVYNKFNDSVCML